MFRLTIVWETGEKEVHEYETREQAEEIARGFKMAFGSQVQWVGIYKR